VAPARTREAAFFSEPFQRFEGPAEEHRTFVLEFKHGDDPRMTS